MTDLLELVNAGERNISQLTDPTILRAAAARVVEFARSRGVTSFIAASPPAERILGAVLMSESPLGGHTRPGGNVLGPIALVVDVNLASGTAVAHAARKARRLGAAQVLAAVLHQLTDLSPSARDCYVDELVVLFGTPQQQ